MKKGLLSFLLAALTLVGCQNYDDQFDELNAKILALQSELTSISAIQSAITDLNTKIAAVQSSALTAADLAGIISDLDAVQAAVENLGSVGTEVENLNAEVDEILAALDDLLAANAVINQDLRITSDAELRYVASLVNLEPTPTVIVNGYVEVDPSFAATNTAKLDSILAITNKINTILGNSVNVGLTTAGTSLTFNELSFLDANMSISGGVVALPKLVTVGGDITLNYSGNYSFPLISRAATITLTDNSGLVAVDFSGLTTANSIQSTAGKLSLTKATSVKLGSISLPASVTLPETTEFVTLKAGAQGAFSAAIGGSVTSTAVNLDLSKMTSLSGTVTVTTGGTSVSTVNLGAVATVSGGATLTITTAGSVDLRALTGTASGVNVTSPIVNLDALAAVQAGGPLTLTEVTVLLPKLATQADVITASSATTFKAELLVVASTSSLVTAGGAASHVWVGHIPSNGFLSMVGTTGILTIDAQDAAFDAGYWFGSDLKTLTIAGKANSNSSAQSNAFTANSSNTALTSITIPSASTFSSFTVSASAAIVTLTTAGAIRDLDVRNMAGFKSLNFGHSHIQGTGSDAATIIVSNTGVLSLDMSSMKKVKTIAVTGNSALASLVAPSPAGEDDLPEPLASITVTVTNNALKGVLTKAIAGTEVTDHVYAQLTSAAVSSLKAYIDMFKSAAAGGNIRTVVAGSVGADSGYIAGVTWDIEMDSVDYSSTAGVETVDTDTAFTADTAGRAGADNDNATAADNQNNGGNITTYNELSLVSATATGTGV
ncbi:MAG: hypothetical protein P8K14_01215 [Flavobacteriaceae bacterium]|nr:hypothetical protein [Flavobacteriaceae bacterium]